MKMDVCPTGFLLIVNRAILLPFNIYTSMIWWRHEQQNLSPNITTIKHNIEEGSNFPLKRYDVVDPLHFIIDHYALAIATTLTFIPPPPLALDTTIVVQIVFLIAPECTKWSLFKKIKVSRGSKSLHIYWVELNINNARVVFHAKHN